MLNDHIFPCDVKYFTKNILKIPKLGAFNGKNFEKFKIKVKYFE